MIQCSSLSTDSWWSVHFKAKVEAFLVERIHILLAVRPIKLLIIDSVANIFRFREEESTSFEKRAKDIQQLGNLLRGLQNRYGLLVVCTNQVR